MLFEGSYPPGVTGDMIPEGMDDMFIPKPACKYCKLCIGDYCTKYWNNLDESYCIPDRDEVDEFDCCDDYEWNGEPSEEPEKPKPPERKRYKFEYMYQRAMQEYWSELKKWKKYMGYEEE